jgi:hypothetical protein
MPAHHEIEETIDEYLARVSIDDKLLVRNGTASVAIIPVAFYVPLLEYPPIAQSGCRPGITCTTPQ